MVKNTVAQKADFTASAYDGCVPQKIRFTDASTGSTVITRTWYTDIPFQFPIPDSVSIQANFNTAGNYHVKLVVTFAGGVKDSAIKTITIYPNPIADFVADQTVVCPNSKINFTDKSTTNAGKITDWSWNLDLSSANIQNPSQVYPTVGTYSISLKVKNNWGCVDQIDKAGYITVVNKPTVRVSINPTSSCKDTLTIFTINNSLDAPSFTWTFGDGGTSTDAAPSHLYTKPGSYNGTVTSSVSVTCSDSKPFTVNIGSPKASIVAFRDTLCQDEPFTFQGAVLPAGSGGYWFFSDNGQRVNSLSALHSFKSGGSYDVSFVATNSWGCADTIKKKIFIIGKTKADFSVLPQNTCNDTLTVHCTNNSIGNAIFWWDFGDNIPVYAINPPPHFYSSPGTHTITLHAESAPACESTTGQIVSIGSPVASIDLFPDSSICAGSTGRFKATTTPAAATGKWFFGDKNVFVAGKDIFYKFDIAGDYDVLFIATNAFGCTDTIKKRIFISPMPQPAFRIDRQQSCKVPFTIQPTNLTPGTGLDFTWNFGDGTIVKGLAPSHTYLAYGTYIVTLSVTDTTYKARCSATTTRIVSIAPPTAIINFSPAIPCNPPASINFSIIPTGFLDSPTQYIWSYGDGEKNDTTSVPNVQHTFNATGSYTVTVKISSDSGCTTTPTRIITVIKDCPQPSLSISYNCPCNRVTLTDTVSNSTILSWDTGDGFTTSSPSKTLVHLFPPGKAAYYTVTVLRRNNITGDTSQTKSLVHIICMSPIILSNKPATCTGDTITFTPSNIDSSLVKRYVWNFGDGPPVIISNPINGPYKNGTISHAYSAIDTYHVTLTIVDIRDCTTPPDTFIITIDGPKANATAFPLTTCDSVLTVILKDSTVLNKGVPIAKWEWNFGDGSPVYVTTKDTVINHLYKRKTFPLTTYAVTLKVTDAFGCTGIMPNPKIIKLYHPVAGFSSRDTLHCNKYAATFTSQSQGQGLTYLWYMGDGSTMTGAPVTHVYAKDNLYDIKLLVKDENGCTDSLQKKDFIKIVKPVARMKIANLDSCAPVDIIFSDSSDYAIKYLWNFGNGGTLSQDKTRTIPYKISGIYPITLVVTGPDGCLDTAKRNINIKGGRAKVLVDPPFIGCVEFTRTMHVTDRYNVKSITWDYNDGTVTNPSESDSVVIKTYKRPGKYIPNVIITSVDGCDRPFTSADTIIVDDVLARFTTKQGEVCKDSKVEFQNNSSAIGISAIKTYRWDFDNGQTSNLPSPPPITYSTPGKYKPQLIVETQLGCRDTFAYPTFISIFADPELLINGRDSICQYGEYWFNSTIKSADTVNAMHWTLNGTDYGSADSIKLKATGTAPLLLSLQVSTLHGCSTKIEKSIKVNAAPVPRAAPDTIVCINSRFNLSASDGVQYHWSPATGISNVNIASPQIIPRVGIAQYTVKVTNRFGCSNSDSIVVQADDSVHIRTAMPPEICEGNSTVLQVTGNAVGYSWTPATGLSNINIANPEASPSKTTKYIVTGASGNTCPNVKDSVEVIVNPKPHITSITASPPAVVAGGQVVLEAKATNDVISYNWMPSIKLLYYTQPKAVWQAADNTTQFFIQVSNRFACTDTASVEVMVYCDDDVVKVPNIFTPNGDGVNDFFRPLAKAKHNPQIIFFKVFNRFGQLVYEEGEGKHVSEIRGWDGRLNGRLETSATYVWLVKVKCTFGPVFQKGTVELIR